MTIQIPDEVQSLLDELREELDDEFTGPEKLYQIKRKAWLLKNHFREIEYQAETRLGDLLDDIGPIVLPTEGVEIKAIYKRGTDRWDQQALIRDVMDKALEAREADPETGEVPDPIETIQKALERCCAISYGRVTQLKQYGLNADMYREERSPGRFGIQTEEVPTI